MGKTITVNKNVDRPQLDSELAKLKRSRKIDLSKYLGKVDFGVDGLTYQLQIRDEWR